MKTLKIFLILSVCFLIFGLIIAACDNVTANGETFIPAFTGTVSINGTAQVGQTLTADTTSLGGTGTISYQWKHGTTDIGTNSSTYTVQAADVGFSITVTVTRSGFSGSATSQATTIITP